MPGANSPEGAVARSGGPAYQQIRDVLADEISREIWKVGSTLPNEKRLSARFRVSIGTIRRAIESLEKSGLVTKMQGLGTFVAAKSLPQPVYDRAVPFKLNNHWATEYVGTEVKTELISLECIEADDEESRALGIEMGDPIWLIEVRHMLHSQLIAYEQLCLSKRLFPKLSIAMLQQSEGNLYRLASEVFQMRIGQMTDEVSVTSMEPRIASLFNKVPDTPSLRVFRITQSMDNTPIEKREVWLDPSFAHYKATPELS